MRRTRAAPRASLDECLPEDVVKRTKKKKKKANQVHNYTNCCEGTVFMSELSNIQ